MNAIELKCLRKIKKDFGDLFVLNGKLHDVRPEVLAGIAMRESNGVETAHGDGGHGHGLMQIDDRSYPEFCSDPNLWQNAEASITHACLVLLAKRRHIKKLCAKFNVPYNDEQLEQMSIAAYNCGANNVVHQVRRNLDIDGRTTGKNYSKNVLEFAAAYLELTDETL